MQNTGQGSEKKSYRIILLLIVGLAAFSSAMKELNQIQAFTLQTGQLIAQLTDSLPNDRNEMLVKFDTCDRICYFFSFGRKSLPDLCTG